MDYYSVMQNSEQNTIKLTLKIMMEKTMNSYNDDDLGIDQPPKQQIKAIKQ